jgi:hypothetical protein
MARFYGTFDNSTNSGLEAGSGSNYYERKAFTDGATLKTALVNTRAALSSAVYAQLNAANRNGDLGIVVPPDAITRGGGTLSFGNVYTNTGAIWPADPRVRPTALITTANSTPVSPVDGGSITDSIYTDATTALGNALAGIADGGPYGRLGLNSWRTLASLWHDHDLTFLAWDDFTPGQAQDFLVFSNTPRAANETVTITFVWSGNEYHADIATGGKVEITATIEGGFDIVTLNQEIVEASVGSYSWVIPANTFGVGGKSIDASIRFRDVTIITHFGTPTTYTQDSTFLVIT